MSCCLGNGREPPFSLRPDRATAPRDHPAALTGRLRIIWQFHTFLVRIGRVSVKLEVVSRRNRPETPKLKLPFQISRRISGSKSSAHVEAASR